MIFEAKCISGVKCTTDSKEEDLLTVGNIYKVDQPFVWSTLYFVTCNDGIQRHFEIDRFETIFGGMNEKEF